MPDFATVILAIENLEAADRRATDKVLAKACDLPADSQVLSALVGTTQADLVARYLAAKRSAQGFDRLTGRPRNVRLDHLIQMAAQSGKVSLIDALHKGKIPLAPVSDQLFHEACRGGHAPMIEWVNKNLWSGNIPQQALASAIIDCGRSLSEAAAEPLSALLTSCAREGRIDVDLMRRAIHASSPKLLAALLIAGVKTQAISSALEHATTAICLAGAEERRRCLDLACSHHGRMRLMALEPSLAALIARPDTQPFLGLGPIS